MCHLSFFWGNNVPSFFLLGANLALVFQLDDLESFLDILG